MYRIRPKNNCNRAKLQFFRLYARFLRLSRTAVLIYCVYTLFYYQALIQSKFVPIRDQLLFLLIGSNFDPLHQNIRQKNFGPGPLSLRRLVGKSLPTLLRHDL